MHPAEFLVKRMSGSMCVLYGKGFAICNCLLQCSSESTGHIFF